MKRRKKYKRKRTKHMLSCKLYISVYITNFGSQITNKYIRKRSKRKGHKFISFVCVWVDIPLLFSLPLQPLFGLGPSLSLNQTNYWYLAFTLTCFYFSYQLFTSFNLFCDPPKSYHRSWDFECPERNNKFMFLL
jgi:hypothetical protein